MSDWLAVSSSVVSSFAALISALAALATIVWLIYKEENTPLDTERIFRFILMFIGLAVGIFILITYFIAHIQKEQKEEVPSLPIIRTVPPQ